MAHYLLHGTLDATILEADHLSNPTRVSGVAPGIFRKVRECFTSLHTAFNGRLKQIEPIHGNLTYFMPKNQPNLLPHHQ